MLYKYPFKINKLTGEPLDIQQYKGKVLLFVNVASECGFTPQYEELQQLYEKYKNKGFEILAFPCNQFGNQEPGTPEEIQEFITLNFGITFSVTEKINIKGEDAHPIYRWILLSNKITKQEETLFNWNFTKFLISKKGYVKFRYDRATTPLSLEEDIQQLLDEKL